MRNAQKSGEAGITSDHQLGFAVLCVQKAVEFSITDHKLHRATKDKELHEELEKLTDVEPSTYLYQLGGGCRIIGSTGAGDALLTSACVGDSVAAFQGTLSNLQELDQMYVPEPENGLGQQSSPAEVVCHMYLKVGMELLSKLRGRFVFCMYESKQGRVLAARDGSGEVQLYQGHSPSEGLVISSTMALLGSCTDVKPFAPGDFKYGWHAEPRQFSPSEFTPQGRLASGNGRKYLSDQAHRIMEQSNGHRGPRPRRRSVDVRKPGPEVHAVYAKGPQPASAGDASRSRRSCSEGWRRAKGTTGDPSKQLADTGRTSSSGSGTSSVGSAEKQAQVLSATAVQVKGLSINAAVFQPSFGSSPPGRSMGPCSGHSPVIQTLGAPATA